MQNDPRGRVGANLTADEDSQEGGYEDTRNENQHPGLAPNRLEILDDLARYPEWNALVPDMTGRTTVGEVVLGRLGV